MKLSPPTLLTILALALTACTSPASEESHVSSRRVHQHASTGQVYFVRADAAVGGDGMTYATAWSSIESLWNHVGPGDKVYLCGTFTDQRLVLPGIRDYVQGTEAAPITFSGACPRGFAQIDAGRFVAPDPAADPPPSTFGINTMRQDHLIFENIDLHGYAVMILDSKGVVLRRMSIYDAPAPANEWKMYGAVTDLGVDTRIEQVLIADPTAGAISQLLRGHNAFPEPPDTSTLWASEAVSFRLRANYLEAESSTVIVDSTIVRTGRSADYVSPAAISLLWNKTVFIHDNLIEDPGGFGIRLLTRDAYDTYAVTGGRCVDGDVSRCDPNTLQGGITGYQCRPTGVATAACLSDDDDPCIKDGSSLFRVISIEGNTIRGHYQTGERPSCRYEGQPCAPDGSCPTDLVCHDDTYTCRYTSPDTVRCGEHTGGIALQGKPSFYGTLDISHNHIEGVAGDGILLESPYHGLRR
ncbi:MAG: hypothetical protein AAFX99_32420 [Myxococcota bacterium]